MPDPSPPPPARFGQADDATRRTWLANERTWLAWVRTGLAATAVAVALGKVAPALGDVSRQWPYELLGVGYAVLGVLLVLYGFVRRAEVETAIAQGGYRSPAGWAMVVFAALTVVLGAATVALLLAG